MAVYFMFGKYSSQAIKEIGSERTKDATNLIKQAGGKLNAIYALLGRYDLVIIAEFPKLQDAMKASLGLTRLTNIGFSTSPAITVEEFDKMVSEA